MSGYTVIVMPHLSLSPDEFVAILRSHGWYKLSPFMAEFEPPVLRVPFSLPAGNGILRIEATDAVHLVVEEGDADMCRSVAGICLADEIDLGPLHQAAGAMEWRWIELQHLGRFLRSPSLFEDCVKILLTINTTFRRTMWMTEMLVHTFGEPVGAVRAFPRPESLLHAGTDSLREVTRCGYRAPFLTALAAQATEALEIFLGGGWRALAPETFTQRLADIPGMGPVSVGYVVRMYGKAAGYAIDSYVRRRCRELWGVEEGAEQFIADRYAPFGDLGPTVLWCELTRHWHDDTRTDPLPLGIDRA